MNRPGLHNNPILRTKWLELPVGARGDAAFHEARILMDERDFAGGAHPDTVGEARVESECAEDRNQGLVHDAGNVIQRKREDYPRNGTSCAIPAIAGVRSP